MQAVTWVRASSATDLSLRLALMTDLRLCESRRINFRAWFFNAFNHPTFPQMKL